MSTEQELQIFCRNLLCLRNRCGLSQAETARLLGVGVRTLSRLEHGKIPPRLSSAVILRAAALFHLPPSRLFSPPE